MEKAKLLKETRKKEWSTITLKNNFVFFKVMQDEKKLGELIHRILPKIKFKHLEIVGEKEFNIGIDIHGIRLDIYAEDESGRAITIEMQVYSQGDIAKRLRYYASIADSQLLEKGRKYSDLPDSYVIMICCFDPFEKGLHKYTFTLNCTEANGLAMNDGVTYIVLNTTSTADDVAAELRSFLDYVEGRAVNDDQYIEQLDDAVRKARMNKRWRKQYMMMDQIIMENQDKGGSLKTIEHVRSMRQKGYGSEEIAEILSEDLIRIDRIASALNSCGVSATDEDIYQYLINTYNEA